MAAQSKEEGMTSIASVCQKVYRKTHNVHCEDPFGKRIFRSMKDNWAFSVAGTETCV